MENHNINKELQCIYYPAIIKNTDQALKTLGGLERINQVMFNKTAHETLELKFRPDDPYCKSALSDKVKVNGLVLKIKIIKKRKKSGKETFEIQPQIVGQVKSYYMFKGICDFQYLPVSKQSDGTIMDLGPKLEISNYRSIEDCFNNDVELFIPPVIFSKIETPQSNMKLFHDTIQKKDNMPNNVIGLKRKTRQIYTVIVGFDCNEVPQESDERIKLDMYIKRKRITQNEIDSIRKIFDERPVCSKNALRYLSKVSNQKLKLILPLVAYYFYTGPFRILWCKLGYDPRKDKNAAKLQTLDFRIRTACGVHVERFLPKRRSKIFKLALRNTIFNLQNTKHEEEDTEFSETSFLFRPGDIPPFKQMYYQYCDIKIPEVEALLDSTPLEDKCLEKNGWYTENISDQIRDQITDNVMRTLGDEETGTDMDEDGGDGDLDEDVGDEGFSDEDEDTGLPLEEDDDSDEEDEDD